MAADEDFIDKHIAENTFRGKYYAAIGLFHSPENESLSNSPSKDDLAAISYVDAYIAVYQETSCYYEEYPNLSQYYNMYISTEQFVQDKKNTLEMLKELDLNDYPIPDNSNDHYYKDSPLCLKKLWAATKLVCQRYQKQDEFHKVNSHLQKFALHYHPDALHSPKKAEEVQMAKIPKKLELPQSEAEKENGVLQKSEAEKENGVLQTMNAFFSRSLPSLLDFPLAKDDSLSRNKSFDGK